MADYSDLFSKTKEFIIDLSKKSCLSSFYIGKAKDVDSRERQHYSDGYECSVEIAHSASPCQINEAEKHLISMFKDKDMPVPFDNKNCGGGGNPDATKLYVALNFIPMAIDDLEDDDLFFESIEL